MKKLREIIKENWHHKKDSKRFYSNGHGYFPVGDTVNTPAVYKGVTKGKIIDATEDRLGRVTYRVGVKLPKGHEEAYDENGEPHHDKSFLMRDDEMNHHNPEK